MKEGLIENLDFSVSFNDLLLRLMRSTSRLAFQRLLQMIEVRVRGDDPVFHLGKGPYDVIYDEDYLRQNHHPNKHSVIIEQKHGRRRIWNIGPEAGGYIVLKVFLDTSINKAVILISSNYVHPHEEKTRCPGALTSREVPRAELPRL